MASGNRVTVVIHGRTYHLSGSDPEHTRRMARTVDETLSRFSAAMPGVEPYQIAILAALHLADELSNEKDAFEKYRAQAGGWAARMTRVVEGAMAEAQPALPEEASDPPDEPTG